MSEQDLNKNNEKVEDAKETTAKENTEVATEDTKKESEEKATEVKDEKQEETKDESKGISKEPFKNLKVIVVTSGKGGVGKTTSSDSSFRLRCRLT